MKTLKLIALLLTINCAAQDKQSYLGFTIGSDITGHYVTELNMVSKNVQVDAGYDFKPDLDYSRMYFGFGYQFPLYAYPGGNEIKTIFTPSIQPSLIDRKGTWGGAFADNNNSSHLSLALNLSLGWDVTENRMISVNGNFLPATDLKAKFPEDKWSEKIVFADTPIRATWSIEFTYKINYN